MKKSNRYMVIMAGGVGSRFWPSSTTQKPKQFLDILGIGKSLLRMTYERCLPFIPAENIIVVTNAAYQHLVKNEIPEMEDNQILCEPSRNNTAPCLAYAALRLKAVNGDAVFGVLPSDHVILKEDIFIQSMTAAFDFAENNEAILTLGITPTRPDTGYGYIHMAEQSQSVSKVISFVEKPDKETATRYVDSKSYLWNAGIFIWSVKTLLSAFQKYEPDMIQLLDAGPGIYNTHGEQDFINKMYPLTKNISIDFAILEKADNVYSLPADMGWSDLGTWNSLFEYLPKNEDGNVVHGQGQHELDDVEDCIIRTASGKDLLIRGLKNFIVIDEADALLIWPMAEEQDIKNGVIALQQGQQKP
ncbi:MAG: mannose-1-phosphate guanylyltransferase [Saprospiraceae bacterium]|nr:mannose-1-phosphate guanylyltransferase [Saprospiraceae bacterium]